MRIAINGFGRIGRTFLRVLLNDPQATKKIEIVAINQGPHHNENIDLVFKHDSIMQTFQGATSYKDDHLIINYHDQEHKIRVFSEGSPCNLPWKELNIDWVVEASGFFTTKEKALEHCNAGSGKVLITAPSKDPDITIIPGINDNNYNPNKHSIVSLGSCTTNCFAPLVKVAKEQLGLQTGLMTTVHAYTNNQSVLDSSHNDPRRGRAAATNIIPTSTGASNVIIQLYPELAGKLDAVALRVPVAICSLVDFTFTSEKELTPEKINATFASFAANSLQGILAYTNKPLVSSDYIGNPHSAIFDSLLTKSAGKTNKIFAWYDNEYGYSQRLKDFLLHNS